MIRAVVLLGMALFLNRELSGTALPSGFGWRGSPLAVMGSRLLYGRAQVPWHNGHDEMLEKLTAASIPGYFETLYFATKPDEAAAHGRVSSLQELARNLTVVRMMSLALDWNPANGDAAYDLSFVLGSQLGRDDLSLQVLDRSLRESLSPVDRLRLLASKFQVLALRMNRIDDARSLVPEIESLTAQVENKNDSNEGVQSLLQIARTIPVLASAKSKPNPARPASRSAPLEYSHE